MGIQSACNPCGSQTCDLVGALVRGTTYTYIQLLNIDFAQVYVYDQGGALVAELDWTGSNLGMKWSCVAGPVDFDTSEAMSLLPILVGSGALAGMCPSAATSPSP